MAKCGACGTTVIFGGVTAGNTKYCNANCHAKAVLLARAGQFDQNVVRQQVDQLFRGQCPKCHGPGPVDVRRSYRVVSMLIATQWKTNIVVACRGCGRKAQLGDLLLSLVAGWWGFPWGLVMTPVQIARNIGAMTQADSEQPSPDLDSAVRMRMASALP
jgi:hypothetical protein